MRLFAQARARPGRRCVMAPRPAAQRQQPAAAGRHPGAGLLAVRDPVRPALLPPGRRRRGLPGARPPSQSVREIVVQPAARPDRRRPGPPAGRQPHLVGGLGRPHLLGKLRRPAARRAAATGSPAWSTSARRGSEARLVTCGDAGSVGRHLLERLALPAGAGRHRRPAGGRAARSSSSREDYPAVLAEQQSVRAYPQPVRHQPRARARLPQPDHRGRVRRGQGGRRPRRSTAPPSVGRAGVEKEYDGGCAGMPGYQRVAVDSMGRVLGDDGEVAGAARRHPGHLASTPRSRAWSSGSSPRRSGPPARPTTRSPARNYVADSGAAVVHGGQHRPGRRDGQPADVRPRRVGRAASARTQLAGSTPSRPAPRCWRAPPRASSRPARRGSRS